MDLTFEWDPAKAAANAAKHGVAFEEASTVFSDLLCVEFLDRLHSHGEERFIVIGHSQGNRLLIVWYTERNEAFRIIGARIPTARERKAYEEVP
jgi:uncharacterized protein